MRYTYRLLGVVTFVALGATAVSAQIQSLEISGNAGYTFSEGVDFANSVGTDGNTYNGIEPKDAFSWGFTIGAIGYRFYELGFLFDRQESKLVANSLRGDKEIADMSVDNYHGYIGFNYARPGSPATPFVFVGFGATSYGGIEFMGTKLDGETQFSTTWGLGVKMQSQSRPLGLRLLARWTPTYVHTNPGGVWCDPYYGCYQTGDAEYSHAIELTGGLVFKFPLQR
jgi:hypothetical protein